MKKKIVLITSFLTLSIIFFIFLYLKTNKDNIFIEKREKRINWKRKYWDSWRRNRRFKYYRGCYLFCKRAKGNEYFLKAGQGTIDQNESNFIFLKSVKATIDLKDYRLIEISSDFGKYNVNNYDTIFSKNVIISYLDNEITGDYLDFSLDKNLMIVSRDVIMKNSKRALQADVIEVNLDTRDIRIFMYEENKKVNIKSLN